eukprot:1712287-Amphidinium_carterae.1
MKEESVLLFVLTRGASIKAPVPSNKFFCVFDLTVFPSRSEQRVAAFVQQGDPFVTTSCPNRRSILGMVSAHGTG